MLKIKSILFILIFICFNSIAQEVEKAVSITVSGSGKTQEEAKQSALRSAIEQAFGAFISSKTEIFNDQVIADQMSSVSSGNIQSFTLLNESKLPDGSWGITLKALVSVSKLTSFVEAKGIAIEIKGGLFAINIKQQILNEQSEIKALGEMVGLLHEPMQTAFDYSIKSGEPKSLDAQNKDWEIPLEVTATANKNMDFCANYFIKTLTALSLSDSEVKSYQSLNKAVFPFDINYNGVSKTFYLRKESSIDIYYTFVSQWEFYTRLFTLQEGLKEYLINEKEHYFKNHDFSGSLNLNSEVPTINFLTAGQQAATFSWQDKRTLLQIEQMTGYKVKPRGVISQFKHGGIIVYEKDGHGLVAAITDLGLSDWSSAKTACDELVFNGYSDWHLPTSDELNDIYLKLNKNQLGGLAFKNYWSSSQYNSSNPWGQNFNNGNLLNDDKSNQYYIRAVRSF
jgi:hypothetical protein